MNQSCFKEDYKEETLQLWVDSLNLLYVAFTRARHNLIIFCQGKDPRKESGKLLTVSDLIQDLFQNSTSEILTEEFRKSYQQACIDAEDLDSETVTEAGFSYGELSLEASSSSGQTEEKGLHRKGSDIALPFRSFIHKTKFKQSNRSIEFSKGRNPEGFSSSYIDRGKLLHRLFSEIRCINDIPSALQNLLNEGLISSAESEEYKAFAEKALNKPEVQDWFNTEYRFFNECSILCRDPNGNLQLKRPDRVVQTPKGVQVIDFKFGKPSAKYRKQVLEYMALLQDMGYKRIEGYLWYVDQDKIEPVKP
jgi:ATP-dependent exoDNAse (exonuclease V) beta subunit (contains helicase and exonuclease domains)